MGHWKLFSVNSFAENEVKIIRVPYTLQECKWGAHLPSLGRSACDVRLVQKPDLLLPFQRRALPLFLDQYLFPFALMVGG